MTDARLFVEGGGNNKALQSRCREGFRKLLERSGLAGRLPRIIACGSRSEAYEDFKTAHTSGRTTFAALLVDSEDLVLDDEQPWNHLKVRDGWDRPETAADDQVFLMTTCMETWIVADREGLTRFFERYKPCLRTRDLPSEANLQATERDKIQSALTEATRSCANAYAKNERSFDALANAEPKVLRSLLPAFARMERILNDRLK